MMRYLMLIRVLNFDGMNAVWLWKMLVADENRNSSINVIDWNSNKMKRNKSILKPIVKKIILIVRRSHMNRLSSRESLAL
jgi:hypothetical protein